MNQYDFQNFYLYDQGQTAMSDVSTVLRLRLSNLFFQTFCSSLTVKMLQSGLKNLAAKYSFF